jgi:Domain of unknown function (DUF5753)
VIFYGPSLPTNQRARLTGHSGDRRPGVSGARLFPGRSAAAYCGLLGAFAVADVDDASRVAYLETVTEGYIVESPSTIAEVMLTFDTLRSETLSRSTSRDLILERAEEDGSDQRYLA